MRKLQYKKWLGWIASLLFLHACGSDGGSKTNPSSVGCGDLNSATVALEPAFSKLNATFSQPTVLLQNTVDPQRWYVLEQDGRVQTFTTNDSGATIFIDISDQVTAGGETGLLGMALSPDFAVNNRIFLSYTGRPGSPLTSYISRFNSNDRGLTADPGSEEILLSVPQPFPNHNGGMIGFGPDGYLYSGLGDGGGAGDPLGNGQNTHTLLGAMLRIDVNNRDTARGTAYAIPPDNPFAADLDCSSGAGCPEIFVWGLRNPWRWSFDMQNGELWLGDVGQNAWEEIDRVDIAKGRNFGWNILEGNHCFNATDCDITGLVAPVVEYGHEEGVSVTGGYVYRGSAIPGLYGHYIYGDFGSGRLWHLCPGGQGGYISVVLLDTGLHISSFAQDRDGEIYIVSYGDGLLYRLAPAARTKG